MNLQFLYENLICSQSLFLIFVVAIVIFIFLFGIRPFQTPNYIEEGRSDIFTNKSKKKVKKIESVPEYLSKPSGITKEKKKVAPKTSEVRKRTSAQLEINVAKALKEQSKASKTADNYEESGEGWTEVLSPKERQKRSRQITVESVISPNVKQKGSKLVGKTETENTTETGQSQTKIQDKKSSKKTKNANQPNFPTELHDDSKEKPNKGHEKSNSDGSEDSKLNLSSSVSPEKSSKKTSTPKKKDSSTKVSGFEIAAFEIPSSNASKPSPTSNNIEEEEEEDDEVVAHLVSHKQRQASNRQKESSSSSDSLIEGFEIVEKTCMKDEEGDPTPSSSSGASRKKNKKMKKKEATTYAATVGRSSDEAKTGTSEILSADLEAQDWCQVNEAKRKKKPRRID